MPIPVPINDAQPGPRVGTLLADRFRVLEVIGRGGMGIVVRAFDVLAGSEVAVKHVRPDLAEDPDYAERLLREAQLARDVSHHNVCRVHDVYRHGDEVLLSMEYVHGETLRKRLDRGPIQVDEALSIARQICAGVAAAHQKGVVHRDLKPENVLLDAGGRAVVLDFGVARKEGTPRDTVTGIALGTPRYMSPEQQQGKAVSPATDVFALGLVIEELYSNEKPPAWLRAIIRKATDRDPGRRYPDAAALGQKLSRRWLRSSVLLFSLGSGVAAVAALVLLVHPAVLVEIGRQLFTTAHAPTPVEGKDPHKTLLTRQWSGAQLATVSPDGKLLAYLDENNDQVVGFLRPLRYQSEQLRSFGLKGQSVTWLSFSPDGKHIAFSTGHHITDRSAEVYVVDANLTGPVVPRHITEGSTPSWFPDGQSLAISRYNDDTGRWHLAQVALSGDGNQMPIEADPPARLEFCPVVSPDGKQLAYVAGPSPGGLRIVPLAGGTAITLDEAPFFYERVQWTPDGKGILYGTENNRGLLSVTARTGSRPINVLPPGEYARNPSLTVDGKMLVYTRATEIFDLWMADRNGENRHDIPVNIETSALGWPLFSPDGQSIAIMVSIGGGDTRQAALIQRNKGTVRVVGKPRVFVDPESFVDGGRSLIIGSRQAGDLEVVPLADAPPPKIEFGPDEIHAVVSPDGKRLATTRMEGKEGTIVGGVWVRPLQAPPKDAECWVADALGKPAWSPDGQQLAVGTSKGMVVISSGPEQSVRLKLTDPSGAPLSPKQVQFAQDGKLLLAQHPRIYEVDLRSGGEVARPIITPERIVNLFGFSISPDGRQIVYAVQPIHSDLWLMESSEQLLARH